MNRDGYRDYQVTQCDVGVSCIQCSCSTVMAHAHSVMYTSIRACFLYFFYNPSTCMFQRIFSKFP